MKTPLLSLVVLCLGFAAQAQVKNICIQAGANWVSIPSTTPVYSTLYGVASAEMYLTTRIGVKESYSGDVGFFIGGTGDLTISKRFFFSTGLNIEYFRFTRKVNVTSIESATSSTPNFPTSVDIDFIEYEGSAGSPIGQWITYNPEASPRFPGAPFVAGNSENAGKTTTLYLQAPILIGTTFFKNKLIVRSGLNLSYLLTASKYQVDYSLTGFSEHKIYGRDGYTKLLTSGMMMVSYQVIPKLCVDLTANTYFTPIFDVNNDAVKRAKYNTLRLGLSYSLSK